MLTLAELNQMPSDAFEQALSPLLEHCSWVLPELESHRPFVDKDAIKRLIASVLKLKTPVNLQMQAIKNHPKLSVGLPQEGFSQSEQKSAGLDQLTAEEFAEFKADNDRYEAVHQMPFIIAVSGLEKQTIFAEIKRRIDESSETEFATALNALVSIACIRVDKLIAD